MQVFHSAVGAAVKKMNEVLNLPKEQQENEYEKLSKRMYNGDFEKSGNQTIFKIGILISNLDIFSPEYHLLTKLSLVNPFFLYLRIIC